MTNETTWLAAVRQGSDGAVAELVVLMTKLMADAANEVARSGKMQLRSKLRKISFSALSL